MSQLICLPLETERLRLTPISRTYANELFDLWSDKNISQMGGFSGPLDIDSLVAALDYFKTLCDSGFFFKWIILDKSTNGFLGECEIYPLKPQIRPWLEWGVGYTLKREAWGNGYMTEAVGRILQLAFEDFCVVRMKADVAIKNEKSFRLLERLGFEAEGIQRAKTLAGEGFCDMALMAHTRERYFTT